MTNKLPVVGKRYRELHNFNEWECSDLIIENEQSETGFAIMTALHNKTKRKVFNLNNYFFRFFEELPEDEAETIKEEIKLPVVGQRYKVKENSLLGRDKDCLGIWEVDYFRFNNEQICFRRSAKSPMSSVMAIYAREFWDYFEELPEDKAETKLDATSESVAVKKEEVKQKFILDSIYYDKQGLPVSIYKKEEEIDRIKMEKLREYFKEKYKSYETQPDENGSFKHIDGAEEETQDLMKKDIFGSGKKQVEREKKIEEETYQTSSIQNRASIWKPVNELPKEAETVIIKNDCDKNYFAEFRPSTRFGTDTFLTMDNEEFIPLDFVGKYCTLTDYINNIEKRIRKLEGK